MNAKKYSQFILENYDDMIALWKKLCQIPAPSHKETQRAAFCKAWLEEIGAKGVYIDDAQNVIFPVNCEGKERITAVVAHTDTVFPETEAFPLSDDGETIRCPGCGDDTASLTVLLYCAKYVVEQQLSPENGLIFACVSGEEGLGNLIGTRQLMKAYTGRIAKFISFDSVIGVIHHTCVGSARYMVTAKTAGGHSFQSYGNKNAIHALSEIICAMYNLDIPHDASHRTTVNVGVIEGGTSVNTIAQSAKMLCEYRADRAEDLATMARAFAEIFENARTDETEISVEIVGERPCAEHVSPIVQKALCRSAYDLINEVTGKTPVYKSASTDCNIPLSMGIPAVCIGVYHGGGAHTREEWVNKESLRTGLLIGLRATLELT